MVEASGERTLLRRCRVSADSRRYSACSRARRRTKSISCVLSARWVSHSSPSSTVFNGLPGAQPGTLALPSHTEMTVVKPRHLRRQPGRHMDTIGDVADGHGFFRLAVKEALPHGSGYLAVERRNGIGAAGKQEPNHGHAERLVLIGRILAAKAHQSFEANAKLITQWPEVLLNQIGRKAVVTRGARRGGGKEHLA